MKMLFASILMFAFAGVNYAVASHEAESACELAVVKSLRYADWKLAEAQEKAKAIKVGGPVSDLARAYSVVRTNDLVDKLENVRDENLAKCSY